MALTDIQIKKLRKTTKTKRYNDTNGLNLTISPQGKRTWYYRYHIYTSGIRKEKNYKIGEYPTITLNQARFIHKGLMKDVSNGIDVFHRDKTLPKAEPMDKKFLTLRDVAEKYFEMRKLQIKESTFVGEHCRYMNHLDIEYGGKDIKEIQRGELLDHLTQLAKTNGVDTAKKTSSIMRSIYMYAEDLGYVDVNIALNLRRRLPRTKPVKHAQAILDKDLLGQYMFITSKEQDEVGTYLHLLPHLAVRPSEIRYMKWSELDFKKREWNTVMSKTNTSFRAYLTDEVIEILQQAKDLTEGKEYVFQSYRRTDRPMSDKAMSNRLFHLGFHNEIVTPHGFRATMQSLGIDEIKVDFEVVNLCLAHKPQNPLGDIYNRSTKWEERIDFYKKWSKFLSGLQKEYSRKKLKVVS